ncbi:hypothetical protein FQN60_007720, partial [Etheostoma spectabile]
MLPSSNRIKLNRVALKNLVGQTVPRRRRLPKSLNNVTTDSKIQEENQQVCEPVTIKDTTSVPSSNEPAQTSKTEQLGPENVTDTTGNVADGESEENCVGTQKARRRNNYQPCKWNGSVVVDTQQGPYTRGKYQQSKPNTRSKCRLHSLKTFSNLRLRFTCWLCTDSASDGALFKRTEILRRVKPRRTVSSMSCQMKLSSGAPLTTSKVTKNKANVDTSSGSCKSRQGNTRVARAAKSARDSCRKGRSKVKARPIGCDPPRPAVANASQVQTGARSIPTGLSNIDRNMHPSPTGIPGSEGSLRRAVRASSCGDSKYIYSQQKTFGEQRQESSSPGPEQSTVDFKIKKANAFTATSKKIIIWIDKYPKVMLCDIAQKFDAFSHDCGFVLPDVLKTKVVHCFKKDMKACPRIQSEKSVCLSQSLTEYQRHLKKGTAVQMLSSHTTCHSLNSWTSEASATPSGSFLLGGHRQKGECRTGMLDRDFEEDPGPGFCLMGSDIHRDKRIKLGDSVKDGILPSTPKLESICHKVPGRTDPRHKEKTCTWMSDDSQSCLEHEVGGSSSFDSAVKENGVHKTPRCELDNPTKTDAAQMSSELFCQSNEVDTVDPESFTCQRVRAYLRKIKFSCARTYMSWPFSNSGQTLTVHTGTTVCPANSNSSLEQSQPCSSNNRTSDLLPDALTDTSLGTAHQVSHQNGEMRAEDGESILAGRNGKTHGNMSSYSLEFAPHVMGEKESLAGLTSDTATLSNPSQHEGESDTDTASSSPVNEPESDSSMSTPSPSTLGLVDWETATTLSPVSSPFTHGFSSPTATPSPLPPSSFLLKKVEGVELAEAHSASASPKCIVRTVEPALFYCEETQMTSWTPPNTSDAFESCDSSLLLPQDEQESDEGILTGRSPPVLEPYYNTSPFNRVLLKERSSHNIRTEKCVETSSNEFMLPPLLSPVTSPQRRPRKSLLPQSSDCSDEEKEIKNARKHKILPRCHMLHIMNSNNENSYNTNYLKHGREEMERVSTNFNTILRDPQSSPSSVEDGDDGDIEEESQAGTGREYDVEQGSKKSEQVPSDPKIKETPTSGALKKPSSSPSSDDDDGGGFSDGQACSSREEGSSPSEIEGSESDETAAKEAAGDTQCGVLDEFTAYEQDILLVDVIQDDPELFENVPQERLLKLGPVRVTVAPKTRPIGVVKTLSPKRGEAFLQLEQSLTPVYCKSHDITGMTSAPMRATADHGDPSGQPDANNNHVNGVLERSLPIQNVNSFRNHIPPLMTTRDAPRIPNPLNTTPFKRQKSNPQYCRQYFSESLSCGFKMCRFHHVPVEGDEKLCIETVIRFTKNLTCLQKAGAVFTGYYRNNPPGAYFSKPVLLTLLWALLKAGMVSDVFSVLSVSLDHKIVPGHEFLLALFNIVREKGLIGVVPELMQLTFKMAGAGLVLSLDCLDCVKNTPEFQKTVNPNSLTSGNKLSTSARFPEYLNLAHSIVEIESDLPFMFQLCTKQEDWRRMGVVFRSICQSSKHPNQVGKISGRIAIALLSESKDKLSLPFGTFAETVCQNEAEDSLILSFLGRIGVSLMLRYHKTHQWAKGRRVVEVLSISKVNYSTLKGLFGNEDGATRCYLVTVATELFLLSGSLEGALNTLRENKWFLSSSSWPCEPADLESRSRVLMRLAEKTSHRDTLEVLCNLPGLQEPNDSVDISRYGPLFNSHLQVCVDRQILPVASDTVDFMLSKNLAVDRALLQMLLQKLGKQNLWLRAREVFRHSLSMGTQSCESEYLSASSRILSAACIPQPKLTVHYTAVNSSQDQVFALDISSARCWLRHNHLWANEVEVKEVHMAAQRRSLVGSCYGATAPPGG